MDWSKREGMDEEERWFYDQGYKDGLKAAEKRGKWGYTEVRQYPVGYNLAKCGCCGWTHYSRPGEKWILTAEDVVTYFNYCPNCGARMEKVYNTWESE